jgi:cyanophycin synthetase
MHVEPESGKPRPVGEAIMDTLFAAGETGRIPIVCVTGAERTGPVTRLLAHLLAGSGRTLGVASAEGITVGGNRIHSGDCRGGEHARGMLINPLVEIALFESSPEAIVSEGVCFQYCDVVVVTSMGEGIMLDLAEGDTPEKRSFVYRGPGDIVTPQGAIVLKAGEPLGSIVAGHAKGRLVLFSTDAKHPEIEEHRSTGGWVVFPRDAAIILSVGTQETALAKVPNLALDETTLAAVAAAWALSPENQEIVTAFAAIPNQS